VKGRNTTVISLRLPDEAVGRLKAKAKKRGLSLSEYLKEDALYQSVLSEEKRGLASSKITPPCEIKTEDAKNSKEEVELPKVQPNQPCPCGALHPDGKPKKYKHCHGNSTIKAAQLEPLQD
jgi:hypothetical protein